MKNEIIELAMENPMVYSGLTKILRLGVSEYDALCEIVVALVKENDHLTKELVKAHETMPIQQAHIRFINNIMNQNDSDHR